MDLLEEGRGPTIEGELPVGGGGLKFLMLDSLRNHQDRSPGRTCDGVGRRAQRHADEADAGLAGAALYRTASVLPGVKHDLAAGMRCFSDNCKEQHRRTKAQKQPSGEAKSFESGGSVQ